MQSVKAPRKARRGTATVLGAAVPKAAAPSPPTAAFWWPYAWGFAAALVCAYLVYSPSLHGEFVFDDLHMPYVDPHAHDWPLRVWFGVRPLLMTTYWANLHLTTGSDTFSYHAVNVFLHAAAAISLFFVLRRLLDLALSANRPLAPARLDVLAVFGAAVFLLHPIQTEAVSYIAQRGEDLGALLYFSAFCVFLYRKPGPVTWPITAAIMALFGAAVVSKEHTVTLPALLLLTDYFFNPGFSFEGIKRNWRLYLVVGIGLLFGLVMVWRLLKADTGSVGFQMAEFNAAQYLFTQFRVFFAYLGLFLYPLFQSIDYDFPVSKTILDQGAFIAGLLIAILVFASFHYRRRFPLAAYGFLAFGILLLPTSSIVPIRDLIADRRLYLPMFGLVLIALEFLSRWAIRLPALVTTLSAVCLLLAAGTYQRNEKWNSALALWEDAAVKSPNKSRVQFGVAASEYLAGQCHAAIPHYLKAISLSKPDYQLDMNVGMALQCDHQMASAEKYLKESIALKPTVQSWANLAMIEAQQGKFDEPLADLSHAEALDSGYVLIYVYRGNILQAAGRTADAYAQFQRALALDPGNPAAKGALAALPQTLH